MKSFSVVNIIVTQKYNFRMRNSRNNRFWLESRIVRIVKIVGTVGQTMSITDELSSRGDHILEPKSIKVRRLRFEKVGTRGVGMWINTKVILVTEERE